MEEFATFKVGDLIRPSQEQTTVILYNRNNMSADDMIGSGYKASEVIVMVQGIESCGSSIRAGSEDWRLTFLCDDGILRILTGDQYEWQEFWEKI